MGRILVTGATGQLGAATLRSLLRTEPADRLVALARQPSTASSIAAAGVEIRQGDYDDADSLYAAFEGVDRVLLISAVAFAEREAQHRNVIAAAGAAGVERLVYTSIQRRAGSKLTISSITESDLATERALMASGLDYTILRNSLYLDVLPFMLGPDVLRRGVRVPGGAGRGALVAHADLADANAVVLTTAGHENRRYTLGGSAAFSFADVAATLAGLADRPVPYEDVTVEAYVARRTAEGLPEPVARFLAEWVNAVAEGEFAEVTGDLERLIGRRPTTLEDFLASVKESL